MSFLANPTHDLVWTLRCEAEADVSRSWWVHCSNGRDLTKRRHHTECSHDAVHFGTSRTESANVMSEARKVIPFFLRSASDFVDFWSPHTVTAVDKVPYRCSATRLMKIT